MILHLENESNRNYKITGTSGEHLGEIKFLSTERNGIGLEAHLKDGNFKMEIPPLFGSKTRKNDVLKQEAGLCIINGLLCKIYYCTKKGSNFINGIYYWELKHCNDVYRFYEVGLKKKGIYLCVYRNDELVAIVSKTMKTRHFSGSYEIYAKNDVSVEILLLFSSYWDITRWMEVESCSVNHVLNTWQKELKEKHDENFILEIKKMHGIKSITHD